MNKICFNPYIPYSGCKQRIAHKIYSLIKQHHNNCDTLIDLFGGGASVSCLYLQNGYRVAYNEYNTGYYALLLFLKLHRVKCIKNNLFLTLPTEWYEFVNREQYFKIVKQNNNNLTFEQLAYKYYVLSVYTFNNLQQKPGYLYNKENVLPNGYLHKALINKDKQALNIIKDFFSDLQGIQNILDCTMQQNQVSAIYDTNRALNFLHFLQDNKNTQPTISSVISFIAEQIKTNENYLQNITQKQLCQLCIAHKIVLPKQISRLSYGEFINGCFAIDHITRIVHIQAILQLPLEKLDLYNLDYVRFPFEKYNNFCIYADPPYFNTE